MNFIYLKYTLNSCPVIFPVLIFIWDQKVASGISRCLLMIIRNEGQKKQNTLSVYNKTEEEFKLLWNPNAFYFIIFIFFKWESAWIRCIQLSGLDCIHLARQYALRSELCKMNLSDPNRFSDIKYNEYEFRVVYTCFPNILAYFFF